MSFAYDNRLQMTSQTYTRGASSWAIGNGFDSLDRVVNTSFSNGEILTYGYNSGGFLESVAGYVNGLDYTPQGKVANRTYVNGLVSQLEYYTTDFRLKSIKTGGLQGLNYTYDKVGNVQTMNDYVNGSSWTYGYDPLDRLVSAVEFSGLNQSYQYNSVGNLMQVSNGSADVNYTYGISAGPHAVMSTYPVYYAYLPSNITSSCIGVVPQNGSVWNITSYTNCTGGVIRLGENDRVQTSGANLSLNNVTLDAAGSLVGGFLELDGSTALELDAGSVIYANDVLLGSPNQSTTTYYVYDANGNMVNDSQHVFEYNDDNRMSRVLDQSGNLVESYQYDQDGNRKVKLTVIKPELNKTTYYLSKAWIREEYSNGTAADTLYVYANNELLARKDASGNKHYYHPDHLGSTTVVTKQDGSLDDRIAYEPWGTPRQQSREMFQFTNQEWEPELGFYDYDARQYNPQLKRFMQPDIIIQNYFDPQSLNRYSYVKNNPIRYSDPTGHFIPIVVVVPFLVSVGCGTLAMATYANSHGADATYTGLLMSGAAGALAPAVATYIAAGAAAEGISATGAALIGSVTANMGQTLIENSIDHNKYSIEELYEDAGGAAAGVAIGKVTDTLLSAYRPKVSSWRYFQKVDGVIVRGVSKNSFKLLISDELSEYTTEFSKTCISKSCQTKGVQAKNTNPSSTTKPYTTSTTSTTPSNLQLTGTTTMTTTSTSSNYVSTRSSTYGWLVTGSRG
jgi:RHS repeat-associated protein